MNEELYEGIVKALEKKKEGAGSYGRPRASLPEDFREQVEYCQKNISAGDLPQKDLTEKGHLLINYVKVLQSEHEHTF